MSTENPTYGQEDLIGANLSDIDQNVLRRWHEGMVILDPRYHDKRLRKAVARSMIDPDFRSQLVEGTAAFSDEEQSGSPDAIEVRFYANTPSALHVLLPPPAGEAESRPGAIRDALRSRTSDATAAWFSDDWDISNVGTIDPPIFQLPGPEDL